MAASNKQPAGSRPGPKKANSHAPYKGGTPSSTSQSPAPKGEVKRGSTPKPTGANPRKLR